MITLQLPLWKGLGALWKEEDQGSQDNREHLKSSGSDIFTNQCGSILMFRQPECPCCCHTILVLHPSIQSSAISIHLSPTHPPIHPSIHSVFHLSIQQTYPRDVSLGDVCHSGYTDEWTWLLALGSSQTILVICGKDVFWLLPFILL